MAEQDWITQIYEKIDAVRMTMRKPVKIIIPIAIQHSLVHALPQMRVVSLDAVEPKTLMTFSGYPVEDGPEIRVMSDQEVEEDLFKRAVEARRRVITQLEQEQRCYQQLRDAFVKWQKPEYNPFWNRIWHIWRRTARNRCVRRSFVCMFESQGVKVGPEWKIVSHPVLPDDPPYSFQQEMKQVWEWRATFSGDVREFLSGLGEVLQAMSRRNMLANPSQQTRAFLRVKARKQGRKMSFVHTKIRNVR